MTALRITSPCHESWDAMTPDREGRHCGSCDKTVVDVTAMAPAAARAYLGGELPRRLQRGERVCVRAHADRSGRLLRGGVTRRLLTNGLAAVLAMALADQVGIGPALAAAEVAAPTTSEPVKGEMEAVPIEPIMGRMAPHQSLPGTVVSMPACLAVPLVASAHDPASGLTFSADPGASLVIATRADGGEAWRCALADHGVPADSGHLITSLTLDAATLEVAYGPGGDRLRLIATSGVVRPRQ